MSTNQNSPAIDEGFSIDMAYVSIADHANLCLSLYAQAASLDRNDVDTDLVKRTMRLFSDWAIDMGILTLDKSPEAVFRYIPGPICWETRVLWKLEEREHHIELMHSSISDMVCALRDPRFQRQIPRTDWVDDRNRHARWAPPDDYMHLECFHSIEFLRDIQEEIMPVTFTEMASILESLKE